MFLYKKKRLKIVLAQFENIDFFKKSSNFRLRDVGGSDSVRDSKGSFR